MGPNSQRKKGQQPNIGGPARARFSNWRPPNNKAKGGKPKSTKQDTHSSLFKSSSSIKSAPRRELQLPRGISLDKAERIVISAALYSRLSLLLDQLIIPDDEDDDDEGDDDDNGDEKISEESDHKGVSTKPPQTATTVAVATVVTTTAAVAVASGVTGIGNMVSLKSSSVAAVAHPTSSSLIPPPPSPQLSSSLPKHIQKNTCRSDSQHRNLTASICPTILLALNQPAAAAVTSLLQPHVLWMSSCTYRYYCQCVYHR